MKKLTSHVYILWAICLAVTALLAFVIPFAILLAVLFIGSRFIADESLLALLSIACLIPYYIGLYSRWDKYRRV